MTLTYNNAQHRVYMAFTDKVGVNWLDVFEGNMEFYSAAYWDLLTRIWRTGGPVRKTDALGYMTGIKSPHTAGKYVEVALQHGLLVEEDNPMDARSKLLRLSDNMKEKLDAFFDRAISELRRAARDVDIKGPSPEQP